MRFRGKHNREKSNIEEDFIHRKLSSRKAKKQAHLYNHWVTFAHMFCVIDIESTGGKFEEESIMEIALYKFDGHQIVDQLISLVNVGDQPIQTYVQKLTGIKPNMLRRAPKFYEIAKRIVTLTEGCVMVAHNADFDYRMLQMEFGRLGYDFNMPTVDTIDWSKKLIPDLPAYGLEKLSKTLGITHTHKHRAEGDALATLDLFKILLEKDVSKDLLRYAFHEEENKHIFSHLTEKAKNGVGVYYLLNVKGKVIFVGRSNFVKNRLNRHFVANNPKALALQEAVADIEIEETGNELLSRIKEYLEIKKLRPRFNPSHIAYYLPLAYYKKDGFYTLGKSGMKSPTLFFHSKKDARITATKWCLANKHDPKDYFTGSDLIYINKNIEDGSVKPAPKTKGWLSMLMAEPNAIVILKGRHPQEKCVLLVENHHVKGYAFIELNTQVRDVKLVKKLISPFPKDTYIFSLTAEFVKEGKVEEVIEV